MGFVLKEIIYNKGQIFEDKSDIVTPTNDDSCQYCECGPRCVNTCMKTSNNIV